MGSLSTAVIHRKTISVGIKLKHTLCTTVVQQFYLLEFCPPPPAPHPNIQHLARKKKKKRKSCTAVDKDKLKNQTSLRFLQSLSASTFFISAAMLEEESKRFQDTWCQSSGAEAPTVSAGWVTSYTATPAG